MGEGNSCDDESDRSSRPEDGTNGISLSLDATLDVLSVADRRTILATLVEAPDNVVTLDELVNQLVEQKAERSGELPSPDHLEMQIHHLHLPKLAEVDLVEYDVRSEEIRYWPDERLEAWLQRAQEGLK